MEAVAAKKVPASDVPAEIVRQLRNLHDKTLDERIAKVWGIVRTTPADRAEAHRRVEEEAYGARTGSRICRWAGPIFAKTCQQCHTLYGVGGKVGPDITGSNRSQPRLSPGKHPRPQRGDPQRLQGDASSP